MKTAPVLDVDWQYIGRKLQITVAVTVITRSWNRARSAALVVSVGNRYLKLRTYVLVGVPETASGSRGPGTFVVFLLLERL